MTLLGIYKWLYKAYGPQGWWPLLDVKGKNPTKTGSINGYHPGDYSYPKNDLQKFEVCVGAILTQNTAWTNVERALFNLRKLGLLDPRRIIRSPIDNLKDAIKPAGYYNQKAVYLIEFSRFFKGHIPTRDELLSVKGIGEETSDSMLLYAFKQPEFVVDAYTKRIFCNLGLIGADWKYKKIKEYFENNLAQELSLYQEYHALIVEHAKRYYLKRPYECPLCGQLSSRSSSGG